MPAVDSPARSLILRTLTDLHGGLLTLQLVKLIYLIDYYYFCQTGRTATGMKYIWDEYGPNASGHLIVKEAAALEDEGLIEIRPAAVGDRARIHRIVEPVPTHFEPILEAIVSDVVEKYGPLSVQELVAESKSTPPFEHARPGKPLVMTRSKHPAASATQEDWDRHVQEKALNEGKTVGEMKEKYGFD